MGSASYQTPKAILGEQAAHDRARSANPNPIDVELSPSFSWPADPHSAIEHDQTRIAGVCQRIRSWVFDHAIPFWAANGLDSANGGFIEQLTVDGRDAGTAFKRTRVAARQIYAFSHASLLGWKDQNETVSSGIAFLINHAWQGTGGGFARSVSRKGEILDSTPDLYDHAFVLFAFAWRHRVNRDNLSREWMHRTLDFIETHLRHPSGNGFWHELPPVSWRLQNPHMHLTEACLAAYESTGEARFADAAQRLIALFKNRLFDRATGTLHEYFDDAWWPAVGAAGRHVEPGHMLEWAWILNQARKLIGASTAGDIHALIDFAELHGVDPVSGATFNAIRDDGLPLDRGSRIWPNTERIKAAVALYEIAGVDPWPVIAQSTQLLLTRYLGRTHPGTWIDAVDASGRDATSVVPASSLYHLMMAFTEVLRISAPMLAPPSGVPTKAGRHIL